MADFFGLIAAMAILVFALFGAIVAFKYEVYLSDEFTCTRYEIIGKTPYRHEVCAVYTRKDGV